MGTVNWNEPIEAVHTDGRVVSVTLVPGRGNPDEDGDYATNETMDDGSNLYHTDGSNWSGSEWSIRNVRTTRTSDEALRRMEALVDRLANFKGIGGDIMIAERPGQPAFNLSAEARAIQAPLEPVERRFDTVLTAITQQGVSEPMARLAARDVLKALDK